MFASNTLSILHQGSQRSPKFFQSLQQDIDNLMECSIVWQLKLDIINCNPLHLCQSHGYGGYPIDGTTSYMHINYII